MVILKMQVIQIACSFIVICSVNYSNGQLLGRLFKSAIEHRQSNRFRLGDVINSAEDATKGIALHLDNVLPTPEEFFDLGKNLILGYPVERAFSAINSFCEYVYVCSRYGYFSTFHIDVIDVTIMISCEQFSSTLGHELKILCRKK